MTLFRVHFTEREPIDIAAATPKLAEAQAKVARPGAFVRKIKVVKEKADG